ncbi:efflux RND transporter periplasmic adaptor subunit [Paracoccus shanxieyensis]|nr:efflux RND transporter periplasmic adaptor subunit [Paracoccus shanxieyensis]
MTSDSATPAPKRRRRLLIALALLAALAVAAMLLRGREQAAPDTTAPPEVVMQLLPSEVHEVAQGGLSDSVQLTGSLVPGRELTISAEVAGRIEAVHVREGDAVVAGQELATIDVETLRNQLEQQQATAAATRAQLELARVQLKRTNDLVARGVTSASTMETDTANVAQLEANYAALMKQVASAEDDLSKARITAPFDGTISARAVNPGAYVTPGTEMLELVDISKMFLEGGVPVNNAPRLATGQRVSIRVDGIDRRSFQGNIDRIAPVAVSGTRVLPVYASIDNPDRVLRGGMFASGELILEQSDGIGIPASAIRQDGEARYVLKIDGDRVVRQDVQIARNWNRDRTAQISSGLQPGDLIVSQPLERLRDGMRINRVGG